MNKSFSGKNWNILYKNTEENESLIRNLMYSLNIPEMTAKIMLNRGIIDPHEVDRFLDAKLKDMMPDPLTLIDMEAGIERITTAILEQQKIFIFGDYDVDGVTSTYLLVQYLRDIGIEPKYCIPNRFSEGYGLNSNVFSMVASQDVDLFIVVDSGINAVDEIAFGNELNIDTIVIDHHMPSGRLPEAVAVINPNRKDQPQIGISRIQNMSAAGVVFMFLVGLQRYLKEKGFFQNINEPDLKNMMGAVALGTICDVMEMRGINRSFVNFALKNQKFNAGIRALIKASNSIESISSSDDFAFSIGPAINAAGRLGDTISAIEMMLAKEDLEATRFANELVRLNTERKAIERQVFDEAMNCINRNMLHKNKAIFVYGSGWHEGVIGVIASKLKDIFARPVFVATFDKSGNGKGSARSVPGVSIFEILEGAKQKGIVTRGGGHELAGGFSMPFSATSDFSTFLNQTINTHPIDEFQIDCILPASRSINKLADEINILEPFGKGVEKPIFCMERVQVESIRETRDGNHMMIFVSCSFGETLRCMLFNIKNKEKLVREVRNIDGEMVDLAFSVSSNQKYGQSIILEDMRLSNTRDFQ